MLRLVQWVRHPGNSPRSRCLGGFSQARRSRQRRARVRIPELERECGVLRCRLEFDDIRSPFQRRSLDGGDWTGYGTSKDR